ncbi:MAG TPA: choice-of-anchor J domain-containing protein [Candidatus Cloacimonadota bacterium]|nr:choice-of-anchor J domain-containing protein [Candidatus Cloacimonadota bacterium]
MKRFMLLIVLLILSLTFLSAQTIAEYTYSTGTNGTLEDMTGSTALLTAGTYYDDTASSVTNIGFTFSFGLGAYTQFSANSNGQMQLGATVISGGSASPVAGIPRIAPLSGDNSIQSTGLLHYKVFGTAPNRKLVVEWKNLRVPYTNETTGTYCTMQAWLFETSNNIQFVYGTMYVMGSSAASRGIYISTSNVAGSVGQLTDITATMTWNNSSTSITTTSFPGGTPGAAMTNLNSTADGSRRVISINYPVYTTAPNTATLLSPANGAYVLTGTSLSWASGGGGAASYDVYFGTSATPPFVVNQGSTSFTPTLSPGNTYYWNIVARNTYGAAAPTATWSMKVPSATQVQESFESTTFPPAGWANPGTWSRSTSYYKDGVACAYKYGSSSSQYILSTPKVTITATSSMSLWTLASGTTGTLQILYSPDRTTWTQIGANITHAATYTFYNTLVDLSSLAGNNYYLGIRTGLQAVSFYVDMIIAPEITPEAPGPVTLSTPADAATLVSEYPTLTWTAPTTGGIPTSYKVYLDTNTTPTTLVGTVTGLTWTATTPLAYSTLHYWTVKASNGAGDSTAPTPRSFTTRANPTISTFPWTVNFGTLTTDWPVLNWSQLAGLPGTVLTTGSTWVQDDFGNVVTTPQNMSARLNVWSTTTKHWLLTPPIAIPVGNYELDFDVALTTYSGTAAPTPGGQADDKFAVYIADNPSMTGATLLREWNNSGSSYIYDNIPAIGSAQVLALNAYSGTKYIAFYGESTVSGGDNNIYVDNVVVRQTPASPIFTLTPTSWDFGQKVINTTDTKQFTITNTGGGTLTISSIVCAGTYYSLTVNPAPVSLLAGQSAFFTVRYAPTAVGTHAGTVTITDSRAVTTVNLSGSCYDPTIYVFPFIEGFEDTTFPPLGWTNVKTAGSGTPGIWDRQTSGTSPTCSPAVGTAMARYNSFSLSSGTQGILATPPLGFVNDQYNVTFKMYRDPGYPGYVEGVRVHYNTQNNLTGATLLGTIYRDQAMAPVVTTTGWYDYTFSLPSGSTGSGYFIFEAFSFYGNNIFIDDIHVNQLLALPPNHVTLATPVDGTPGVNPFATTLTWNASTGGGLTNYYQIYVSTSRENITEGYTYYDESTNPSYVLTPQTGIDLGFNATWYWAVLPANNVYGTPDIEDPAFQVWSFTTLPDPAYTSLPRTENFDSVTIPTLPYGWSKIVSTTSTGYVQTTTSSPNSTPNHVSFYNSGDIAATLMLVSPRIAVGIQHVKLKYWAAWYSYSSNLAIGTMSDPTNAATFTQFATITPTSTYAEYVQSFNSYAGTDQYIAFKMTSTSSYAYMYLDTISFNQILATDLAATKLLAPAYGYVGSSYAFYVTIYNNGSATQTSLNVHLKRYGDDRLATVSGMTPIAPEATLEYQVNWIPTAPGVYNLCGEVEVTGDGYAGNNETTPRLFYVYPADSYTPVVGDPLSTVTTNNIPLNFYWKNSVSETIYTPREMQMTSGTIQGVAYFNNFTQTLTGMPVKIYAKNTTSTDVSASWLDFTGYTLVFNGTVDFPIGSNAVYIPFSTPIAYTGGNFALRVNRPIDTVYYANTNLFYYSVPQYDLNRTRYVYSDSETFDPTNPGIAATASTLSSYIPVTAFMVTGATPVTLAAPVVNATYNGTALSLSWTAVPGAYAYRIYSSDDPFTWPSTPETVVWTTSFTPSSAAKKFYKVVAVSSYRNQASGGKNLLSQPVLNNRSKPEPVIPFTNNKD